MSQFAVPGRTVTSAEAGRPGLESHDGLVDPPKDTTLAALDALAEALAEVESDLGILKERLRALGNQRAAGLAWRDIVSSEEPPGTMQVVSRMLAALARASGTLRKDLVEDLRAEGMSIPAIARLFGVTHQRVSNLLRRP